MSEKRVECPACKMDTNLQQQWVYTLLLPVDKDNKRIPPEEKPHVNARYSGIMRCGVCGHMNIQSNFEVKEGSE